MTQYVQMHLLQIFFFCVLNGKHHADYSGCKDKHTLEGLGVGINVTPVLAIDSSC